VGWKTELQAGLSEGPAANYWVATAVQAAWCSFVFGQNLRTVGWFAFRVFAADGRLDGPGSNFGNRENGEFKLQGGPVLPSCCGLKNRTAGRPEGPAAKNCQWVRCPCQAVLKLLASALLAGLFELLDHRVRVEF
jgi:hypothetical protein